MTPSFGASLPCQSGSCPVSGARAHTSAFSSAVGTGSRQENASNTGRDAAIAQLVEHVIRNDGVGGSNPSCGTIFKKPFRANSGKVSAAPGAQHFAARGEHAAAHNHGRAAACGMTATGGGCDRHSGCASVFALLQGPRDRAVVSGRTSLLYRRRQAETPGRQDAVAGRPSLKTRCAIARFAASRPKVNLRRRLPDGVERLRVIHLT